MAAGCSRVSDPRREGGYRENAVLQAVSEVTYCAFAMYYSETNAGPMWGRRPLAGVTVEGRAQAGGPLKTMKQEGVGR